MSKFDEGQRLLSLTGQSLSLCQRLTRIENETSPYLALDDILKEICSNFELDAAAVVMRKPHQLEFTSFLHDIHSFGLSAEEKKRLSYFLAQTVVPQVLQSRILSKDEVRQEILGESAKGQRTRMVSMLAVPMLCAGEVVGVFLAFRSEIAAFCVDDETSFLKLSSLLVEEIENAVAFVKFARDPVTGFYNRRVFFEAAVLEAARARRYQASLSALLLEFEIVLPQFLKRFAQRIASEIRQSDIVGRVSDSSFLFLQPMTNAQNSFEFAKRICKHLHEHPILVNESLVPINVSIGISSLRSTDDDAGAMLLRADVAASTARRNGSNQIVIHPDSLNLN